MKFTPFRPPQVLKLANAALESNHSVVIERLTSKCTHGHHPHHHHQHNAGGSCCGREAQFTQKLVSPGSNANGDNSEKVIEVGGEELYAPACETHHTPHAVPKDQFFSLGQ
jgi:Thymidine kinase